MQLQERVIEDKIGTATWARRWRVELVAIKRNLLSENGDVERLARYLRVGREEKVWKLLNRPNGGGFKSLEAFYEADEPTGLGGAPVDLVEHVVRTVLTADERGELAARLTQRPPESR